MIVLILFVAGISCFFFVASAVRESGGSANYVAAIICSLVFLKNFSVFRTNRKGDMAESIHQIEDKETLEKALSSPRAILYKHSTRCPISSNVYKEVQSFARRHPDIPVFMLKVREHRELSEMVSEGLGVAHETPQIFLLNDGIQTWNASHYDITEKALRARVNGKDGNAG